MISRLEPKKKITTEEVQLQIKTLKKKKAADTKGWVNEYLIHGGSDLAECIQILISPKTEKRLKTNIGDISIFRSFISS